MGLSDEDLAPQSTGEDDLPSDDGDFGMIFLVMIVRFGI
jgi:hypothetical protein